MRQFLRWAIKSPTVHAFFLSGFLTAGGVLIWKYVLRGPLVHERAEQFLGHGAVCVPVETTAGKVHCIYENKERTCIVGNNGRVACSDPK